MNLPPGKTEADFMEAVEKVVAALAAKFVFAYYAREDIEQEVRLWCCEVLPKWDGVRAMDALFYSHARNRLLNLQRDKLRRNDPPCRRCHAEDYCDAGEPCNRYLAWLRRNTAKANLARPLGLEYVADEKEPRTRLASTVNRDAENAELFALIDASLPAALRADYLAMREGAGVPRARRQAVLEAVRVIVAAGDGEA